MRYISRFKNSLRASSIHSLAFMLMFALAAGLTTYNEAAAQNPSITLSASPATVAEETASTTVTVTATLSTAAGADTDVVVSIDSNDTRYADIADYTITVAAGATTQDGTFDIAPIDDDDYLGDLTINITGAADNSFVTGTSISLIDEDADVTLSITGDADVEEDGGAQSVTVTATAPAAVSEATTITLAFVRPDGETESSLAIGGTASITIASGATDASSVITVTPTEDATFTDDRTLSVTGTSGALTIFATTINLIDAEAAPTATLSFVSPSSLAEEGGAQEVTLAATLSHATSVETTVDPAVTAAAASFSSTSPADITIAAGSLEGTTSFTLTPVDNDAYDGDVAVEVTATGNGLSAAITAVTIDLVDEDFDIGLVASPVSITEDGGTQSVVVTATYTDGATADAITTVTLDLKTGDEAFATIGGTQSITFGVGDSVGSTTVTLAPITDNTYTGDRTLTIENGTAGIDVSDATVTLVDAEATPTVTLSILDAANAALASIAEDGGTVTTTAVATLSHAAASDVVVTVSIADDDTRHTAIADFTVTVTAGNTTGETDQDVVPVDDAVYNGDYDVVYSGAADGYEVTNATLAIVDEDFDVSLTVNTANVTESGGAQSITVTATAPANVSETTTVTLGFSGDGAAAVTIAGTTTITIASGAAAASSVITVTPTEDTNYTGDRSVVVDGTSGALDVAPVTLTLVDAEAAPTVALTASPTSIAEEGGDQVVTITATLSHTSATDTEITITPSEDAGPGTFYTTVPTAAEPGVITIAAGSLEGTTTSTVTAVDDADYDGDQTVEYTESIGATNVQVTLVDEDFEVNLTASPTSITEEGGAQSVVVTATLPAGTTADAITTYTLALTAGTSALATVGGTQSITIDVGESEGSATLTLAPTDDAVYTGDQDLIIESTTAGIADSPVTLTLVEDEAVPTVTLSTVDAADAALASIAEEGGTVTATVIATLSHAAAADVVVVVSVPSNDTRYTDIADFDVTVAAGATVGEADKDFVPTDDDVYNGDLDIVISGAADGYEITSSTLTLVDEDFDLSLSVDDATVTEAGGTQSITVTATNAGGNVAETTTVTLGFSGDGAAAATIAGTTSITIASGSASATSVITVAPTEDSTYTGDLSIVVDGTSGALDIAPVTLTITDTEAAVTATIAASPTSIAEEGGDQVVTITATLSSASATDTEVTITVSEDATYYASSDLAVITIAAGSTEGTTTSTVTPVDDETYNSDQTITYTESTANNTATVTLVDEDFDVALTASPASVTEDGGTQSVIITATIPEAGTAESAITLTLDLKAGDEALATIGGTQSVTIGTGANQASTTVTLAPVADNTHTGDQTLTVENTAGAYDASPATVTLVDAEALPTVTLSILDAANAALASIGEDGGTVTTTAVATLSAAAASDIVVTVSIADDDTRHTAIADFTVTVTAGNTTGETDQDVVPVDDAVYNGDYDVVYSGAADGYEVTNATLAIVDEDFDITLSITGDGDVEENGGAQSVTVTATAPAAVSEATTVTLSFTRPDGETESSLAIGGTSTVTIASGATAASVIATVTPTEDTTYTGNRTIEVSGTSGALAIAPVDINLVDTEAAPTATIVASPTTTAEDGGDVVITITATLSHASATDTEVTVTPSEDAGPGTFYTTVPTAADPGVITIAAGSLEGTGTSTITPVDDADYDGDQTVTYTASLGGDTATVTIVDEDFDINLSASTTTITEDGGAQTILITATLPDGGVADAVVTYDLNLVAGDEAIATIAGTQEITIGIGASSGSATITLTPVNNDAIYTGDQVITVEETTAGLTDSPVAITLTDDEAIPTVTLSLEDDADAALASIAEEGGTVTATVIATLSHAAAADVVVTVSIADDDTRHTAIADFTVTVTAGNTTGETDQDVAPVDDDVYNGDYDIVIAGVADNTGEVTSATLAIVDEDIDITLSITGDGSVEEDGGAQSVTVTATAPAAVAEATTVTLSFTRPDGETDSSITITGTSTITIASGGTTASSVVEVTPTEDTTYTGDRAIEVSGTSGALAIAPVDITLADAEAAPTATIVASPTTTAEDGGDVVITITATLSHASATDTEVTVTPSEDAGPGTFYTTVPTAAEPGVITIAAGSLEGTGTSTITPVDDADYDGDQTVTYTASLGGDTATVTIVDEDFDINLSASTTTITEDGGAQTILITATLPDGGVADAVVTYDLNLVAGDEALATIGGTQEITIGIGASSGSATITLTPVTNDAIYTGDQVITVEETTGGLTDSPVAITLTDDEAIPTVTLSTLDAADAALASIAEEGGTVTATVVATLSHNAAADVVVTVSIADDDTRHTAIADFTVTVAAGSATGETDQAVVPVDDDVYNGDYDIVIAGVADNTGEVTSATLAILDEDADVDLSVNDATVTEAGGAQSVTVTGTVTGGGNAAELIDISLSFTGEGADGVTVGGTTTITIAAGAASAASTITLTPTEDGIYTADRTIEVSGTSGALAVVPVDITLEDAEAAPTATIAASPATLAEEGGDQDVTITATLSHASATDTEVTVTPSEDAGPGTYYTTVPTAAEPGVITIAAGSTSGTATSTVTAIDNDTYDGNQTITYTESTANNTATVSLVDEDFDVSLSVSPDTIDEESGAQSVTVTATLADGTTAEAATTITLSYTRPAGEDVNSLAIAGTEEITIGIGASSGSSTLTITPTDNSQYTGDQEIVIDGTSAGLDIAPATVALRDFQNIRVTLSIDLDPAELTENSGATDVVVTATQSDLTLAATTVTITTAGTATADDDYTLSGDTVITIASGETTGTGTLTITPIDDFTAEGDGNETIEITATAGDYRVVSVSLSLIDHNLVPLASVAVAPATISEGAGATEMTVTATLDGTSGADVTVLLDHTAGTAESGVDFDVAAHDPLVIAAGESVGTFTITYTPIDDSAVEGDEEITITASVEDANGVAVGDAVTASVSLTDNDATGVSPTFALSILPSTGTGNVALGILEGSETEFTITATASSALDAAQVINLVPDLTTNTIDAEDAPDLFVTFAAGMLITIDEGETTGTLTISTTSPDDTVYEGNESVTLQGQVGTEVTNDITLTLVDNDAPTVTLASSTTTLLESAGSQQVTFTATMTSGAVESATALDLTVANGTATSADYSANDAVLTIAADATTGTAVVTFSITDDEEYEPTDETIIVSADFSNRNGTTATTTHADLAEITLSVVDNFTAPTVASALGAITLEAGETWTGDVASSFTGKALTYSATSTGDAVSAQISGSSLAITGQRKGSGRVSVMATNVVGSVSFDMDVTVTAIAAEKAIFTDILAATGRNIMSSVSQTIGSRFSVNVADRQIALANRRVDGVASGMGALISLKATQPTTKYGFTDDETTRQHNRQPVSARDLVRGSSFYYALDDTPQGGAVGSSLAWTVWGAGDWNAFEGAPTSSSSYDGTLTSGYIGLDVSKSASWIAGVAVGHSKGTTDYDVSVADGTLETTLNSLYPYLHWTGTGGAIEVWGIGGFGSGEAEANNSTSDLSMTLGMVGVRAQLFGTATGGLDVDLIGDAGITKLSTSGQSSSSLNDLEASVQRIRIGLEGSRTADLGNGVLATPFAQFAGRYDGGDGQTGNGLEVTGGLRISGGRAGLEARGRMLAIHTGDEVKEHGLSVNLYVRPVGAGGQGLSMSIAPRLGADTQMSNNMWGEDPMSQARLSSRTGAAVKASIGYGLVHPAISSLLVTPFGTMDMAGDDKRRMRLGARFGSIGDTTSVLSFELAGERIQGNGRTTDHRIGLLGRMSF